MAITVTPAFQVDIGAVDVVYTRTVADTSIRPSKRFAVRQEIILLTSLTLISLDAATFVSAKHQTRSFASLIDSFSVA